MHRAYINFLETGELPTSPLSPQSQTRPQHQEQLSSSTPVDLQSPVHGPRNDKEKENEEAWDMIELQRSQWFSLLDPDDRVEAFRGLWGVMAWLMRSDQAQLEKQSGSDEVGRAAGTVGGGGAGSAGSSVAALDEDVIMSD